MQNSEVYDWIRDNDAKTKIEKDAFSFLDLLTSFSESYSNVINGRASDGSVNPNISNLRKLAGRARQHFPFLIAIKSFPKDKADNFIRATESILVAYGIQRMYTGDIEKTFSDGTLEANNCQSTKEIEAFYTSKVTPEVKKVGSSALDRLSKGDELTITKQKLVYLLCRLDAFLQMTVEPASVYKDIGEAYKGIDVEHILSQASIKWKDSGFSTQEEFELYKHKIGNLTILEKPLNRAIKDKPFFDKKNDGYQHSKYLITKGIAVKIPGNNSLAKALKYVEAYNEWTKEIVDKRQNNLVEIAALAFGWK